MPIARIRGQAFHYTDTGGDDPAILFSHGFLMDGEMFAPQVEALKDRYRVLTWDWRGFGQTETDGQYFTVWDQAEDLIALLDHLEIGSAFLGGMSHGGYITMRVPLIAPTRVKAIVLMATSASALTNEQKAAYRLLFTQWIHQGPTEELAELFANLIIGEPRANEIWKAKWKARSKELLLTPAEATMTTDDIRSRLGEIRCPAIVIHGLDDAAFPVSLGEELASALPECDPCILVSGGHAANLTHPESVNAEIVRFLDGLRVQ